MDIVLKYFPVEEYPWDCALPNTNFIIKSDTVNRYETEAMAYDAVHNRAGFVKPYLAGNIVCSSILPHGFALVMEFYKSVTLRARPELRQSEEIKAELREIVRQTRLAGFVLEELHDKNVLCVDGGLRVIDLESAVGFPVDEEDSSSGEYVELEDLFNC